jgi:UDPglucose 6-dehydrogenase
MHTMVFKEARGFAGKCLPKDINGIVQASIKAGYTPELLIQVLKSNEKFRKKNKKKKE